MEDLTDKFLFLLEKVYPNLEPGNLEIVNIFDFDFEKLLESSKSSFLVNICLFFYRASIATKSACLVYLDSC